jgi:hypothetical protein
MIRRFFLAVSALVALASGCASFDGRGLVPGKSTQAKVEALMGVPAQRRVIWVQFSSDGIVREVLDMLDWDYEKPGWRKRS